MPASDLAEEASRHKCLIYEGHPRGQLPVVVPLLQAGMRERRRCVYIGEPEMVGLVRAALSDRGVDVEGGERRGALVFSSDRSHLRDGVFDPASMVALLVDMIDQAVRDGWTGLCAAGDMAWELGGEENFDRLLEYEALLEAVFREKPLNGICLYRRGAVPSRALADALSTHRSLFIGTELRQENHFYLPPELHLGEPGREVRDGRGEWMCEQIRRVLHAEEKRDQALRDLRESEARQRRLAEDLMRMNQDLDRRVRERTEELEAFTYSVSHDLRAPLRAIDGFSRILLEENASTLNADGRRQLDHVVKAAESMGHLIEGLLRLSRISSSNLKLEDIDLQELSRGALVELLGPRPPEHLDVVLGPMPPAWGDRLLLRQVLLNLIGNAIKYSGKRNHPRIEIGGASAEEGPTFWVRDNGVGFDRAGAQHLFEAFSRLHPPQQFEGTGVGLAIVQRIVRRHGGRVWAEAVPDRGATFFFTLPRKPDAGRTVADPERAFPGP